MKNKEIVQDLIDRLKNQADSEFELHRIEVLERDLFNPPKAEIIDDKHQKFDGVIYSDNAQRHLTLNEGIYRAVYRYYRGEIPDGYEIHHIDENPANNDISNLQCLSKAEHRRLHRSVLQKKKTNCKICGKEIAITSGEPFCSSVCRRKADAVTRKCEWCGADFQTNKYHDHRFCSIKCARAFQYRDYYEIRKCPVCGEDFKAKKSSKKVCCSKSCKTKLQWTGHREIRECKYCGKNFEVPKAIRQYYCSVECRNAAKINGVPSLVKNCAMCGKFFFYKQNATKILFS